MSSGGWANAEPGRAPDCPARVLAGLRLRCAVAARSCLSSFDCDMTDFIGSAFALSRTALSLSVDRPALVGRNLPASDWDELASL